MLNEFSRSLTTAWTSSSYFAILKSAFCAELEETSFNFLSTIFSYFEYLFSFSSTFLFKFFKLLSVFWILGRSSITDNKGIKASYWRHTRLKFDSIMLTLYSTLPFWLWLRPMFSLCLSLRVYEALIVVVGVLFFPWRI